MSPFYLGKTFDPAQGKTLDPAVQYDPADLTTHGVVVGMTGSGKTGLCIGMLEEAALAGIPALIVDPKGDLTNLLLHFPDLAPADFQPWIDPEAARREGKPLETLAAETASRWKDGLAGWGISSERIRALQQSAGFAVYTPGSDAGIPVSILASLKAPNIPWEGNREILRERISSTVIALLGLVGFKDIDPVRSREHILLSNIFEAAWSKGLDLDLTELILQTQSPPFEKLGVFPVDRLFPEKDRIDLAMLLNNFLASPSFQTWIEGQPLDIPTLLYTPDGRPRHCVFYLAHLDETERMFFVTLLFSAFETWMRTQSGSTGLRALLYFDEIMGYLPPLGNPPSKTVILRMLKQARAFGVGLLLASQNPVDIDYKALSNAGTWIIGKLQTDQDKQRLMDGLVSAGGTLDRAELDRLISALGKRVFLLHNVHAPRPVLFQTRWTMNYLAGPLTRAQIPALNRLVQSTGATSPASAPAASRATSAAQPAITSAPVASIPAAPPVPTGLALEGSATRPTAPAGVTEYFYPNNLTLSEAAQVGGKTLSPQAKNLGILYRPALVAQAQLRYLDRKYGMDTEVRRSALVRDPDRRGYIRWDDSPGTPIDPQNLDRTAVPQARFSGLDAPFTDVRAMNAIQKDFLDWVFRTSTLRLRANETLKVYAGPDVSPAEFKDRCSQAAREASEAEIAKTGSVYDRKLAALQDKLAREQRELDQDQEDLSQRKMEEFGKGVENVLGLLGGRKRSLSTSLTKRRMTSQAKADVDESRKAIADFQKQIADLEREKARAVQEINDRWAQAVAADGEVSLKPMKKDIFLDLFGLAWLPFYVVQDGDTQVELPAYG